MKEMKDLRIAYFSSTMVEGQDGVTRTLFKIVDFLKAHHIVNRFYSSLFSEHTQEQMDIVKVNSIRYPFYKDYSIPFPNKRDLYKNLDEFKPNILHLHTPCPLGKAAIKYGKKNNILVFATYHTHFPSYLKYYKIEFLKWLVWIYLRNFYKGCDHVFVPTKSIMDELEQHKIKNLVYLPNGIDLHLFSKSFYNPDWKKKIGAEGKNVLLFVGRLVWEKDLRILIEVNKILREKRDDFVFVFIGDGPAQEELESHITNSIFLDRLAGDELSESYASSDMFVFPSTTETFGIVILEAMASALPSICVAKNGPLDLIEHKENGLLAQPDNPQDFSEKIEMLLDDKALADKIRTNASQFAQDFSWNTVLKKMFKYYTDLS